MLVLKVESQVFLLLDCETILKKKNLIQVFTLVLFSSKMVLKFLIICVIGISALYIGYVAAGENVQPKKDGYDTKYDNIDLDELLKNDRLRKNYVKCLLNQGPCTPDAQELKSKSKSNRSPFKLIHESISTLKDFLVRLTSRRDRHQLLKMHREAKEWFRKSNALLA